MKPVNGLISSTCYQGQSAKQFDGRSEVSNDGGRKVQLKPVGGLQPFWEGTQLPRHQRHCGAHRVGLFHTLHIREREGEIIGLTTFSLGTSRKMKNQTLVYGRAGERILAKIDQLPAWSYVRKNPEPRIQTNDF